jgi:hypothetical protein
MIESELTMFDWLRGKKKDEKPAATTPTNIASRQQPPAVTHTGTGGDMPQIDTDQVPEFFRSKDTK